MATERPDGNRPQDPMFRDALLKVDSAGRFQVFYGESKTIPCVGVAKPLGAPRERPVAVTLTTYENGERQVTCPLKKGVICTAADLWFNQARCIQLFPENSDQQPKRPEGFSRLTSPEVDVLYNLARGLKRSQVAKRVGKPENTIQSQLSIIRTKLAVDDNAQAVGIGIRHDLFPLDRLAADHDFSGKLFTYPQLEVLRELTNTDQSGRNKAIASRLGITEHAVKGRLKEVFAKHSLNSRSHAAAFYVLAERLDLVPQH